MQPGRPRGAAPVGLGRPRRRTGCQRTTAQPRTGSRWRSQSAAGKCDTTGGCCPRWAEPRSPGRDGQEHGAGHAILVDTGYSGGDETIRVDAIGAQKGGLVAEIVLANGTEADAYDDQQQERLIEVKVNGDPIGGAEAWHKLLTSVTRKRGLEVGDGANLAIGSIDHSGEDAFF